jgi:hypothetical protein
MPDIIKTWPSFVTPEKVAKIFRAKWARFYFSLGRGRPKQEVSRVWYTYRGRILGSIPVEQIVRNDGSLPKLRSLSDRESEWQFKHDIWVAVCLPPMARLKERIYHEGFRGWRYFDFGTYRTTVGAKVRI